MPSPETPSTETGTVHSLVGYFDTPGQLVQACEELRDAGYRRFDAHSPFPVHGIERAMGLRASRVPWLSLAGGLIGGLSGLALQIWTMGVDYPQNISGKPLVAFQAYIPVTFELTILLAAFGTFFGTWALSGLPEFFHPVMQHPRFGQATDDKFFVSVEAADPHFDAQETRALLQTTGAKEIEEVKP